MKGNARMAAGLVEEADDGDAVVLESRDDAFGWWNVGGGGVVGDAYGGGGGGRGRGGGAEE